MSTNIHDTESIEQLNHEYELFTNAHPITDSDIQKIKGMQGYAINSPDYDYVLSNYLEFIKDLYHTTNKDKICEIGTILNDKEGFLLMLNILYVLKFILNNKTNNDDFITHVRVIEMTWDGIGDWNG